MPTYDYKCKACEHTFEEFQMMSDPELRKCPECGKLKLERLIGGGAGFLFKGSGYYVTDYRSKGYQEAAKSDAPPQEKEPKKDGGGSEKSTKNAAPESKSS